MLQLHFSLEMGILMRLSILLGLLSITLGAFEGYNGKTFLLPLSHPSGYIAMGEKNIAVRPHPIISHQGIALLPIDYYPPSKEMDLIWHSDLGDLSIPLNAQTFAYPTETLSVDSSKVTPPPEALERIALEKAEAEAIYNTITPKRYWSKPFVYPMDSNITSQYGTQRTYNDVLKSYHGGVDFRARTPLPIQAANDGVVVLVKDRYYAGGTVIIDHGEGLYSCYFHMSRFDVNVGDVVSRAQNIGLTGSTGRITGPHLHFGIMVYNTQTDPLNLIDQINALFPKESHETLTLR